MSRSRLLSFGWLRSRAARTLAWEKHYHAATQAYRDGRMAEAVGECVLAVREAEWFDEGDMRLVVSLSTLASLYRFQGRDAEAEPLCLRVLALKERSLGPEHPNVAATLKDLVEIYRALGKTAEAESCHARAFAILERAIGPDLPELSESLSNSAILGPEEPR